MVKMRTLHYILFVHAVFPLAFAEENDNVEVFENTEDGDESEDFRRSRFGGRGHHFGHRGGHGGVVTHVSQYPVVDDLIPPGVVRTRVTVQKRILRPVIRKDAGKGVFENAYRV